MRHHFLTPARLLFVVLVLAVAAAVGTAQQPPASARPAAPAGTADPGIDAILKDLATWDSGIESAAVWKLRDYVDARKNDAAGRAECEAKLLPFLRTPAAAPARLIVARHLRLVAGDTAVAPLQAMLADERSFDLALYVLERIPGAAADKALIQVLGAAAGNTKTSVIASLGNRRSLAAVTALTPLLKNPAFAGAAATALGAIGGADATDALAAALPVATGELKGKVASAMMRSAEQALAAKNAAGALKVYEALSADASLPSPIRYGAAAGRISAAGDGAQAALVALLGGSDAALQQVAASKIKEVVRADAIGQVCALMPRLPEAAKIQVLAALSGYPKERVLPTVMEAAKSESVPVRMAAFKALEKVGDESALAFLLEAAAKARGTEQAGARSALGLLKGQAVDTRLMQLLANPPSEDVEGEVLLAVAERRVYVAKPAVSSRLGSPSARIRTQALRALRAIGTPSDIPAVLDILVKAEDGPERVEAEATVGALAQKVVNSENRSASMRMRLMQEKDPAARARLLGVLPRMGDAGALPLVRAALADSHADVHDAAVRALTSWPTSAAKDDVFRLARDSRNETHRLLAVRALVRMITLDRYRNPAAVVDDLRLAAAFAWRPEEQKLVLGALTQFPCREALELANSFQRDAEVKAEADTAVGEIQKRMAQPTRRF